MSGHDIDRFVDIGTPHAGSSLMLIYNAGIDGLADSLCGEPVCSLPGAGWLVRQAIDLAVHQAWKSFDLYRVAPDPTSPAAQQLDPTGQFIAELNRPSRSPMDVRNSMVYGDVSHIGLVKNAAVNDQILKILEEPSGTPPAPLPTEPPVEGPTEPPGGAAETATVLVVDVSGSMGDAWQGGVKIESAKQAALAVLDMVEQDSQAGGVTHQVAVATFTNDAVLVQPLTADYAQARQAIQALTPLSGTNLGAGLEQANLALQAAGSAKKIAILLSDGQSNVGLPDDQIVSGPAQAAAQAGTCIYTVGFGDPGDLNEDLLRRIAQAACGQYAYAQTPYDLERIYLEARHRSTGQVIASFGGQVAQDETTAPQAVTVPAGQGEMHVTLSWPGSRLDMILTDPSGKPVDAGYPGVTLRNYARMLYIIIANPIPGPWQAAVRGVDVPEMTVNYEAIFSVRQGAVPQGDNTVGILLLLVVLIGAGTLVLVSSRRVGAGVQVPLAGVQTVGQPGRWATFRRGALVIGREPACELVLTDPLVSRLHARIVQTPQGCLIEDLGSKNGTWVNGQRVASQYLRSNDLVQVGETRLVFWDQRGR